MHGQQHIKIRLKCSRISQSVRYEIFHSGIADDSSLLEYDPVKLREATDV